VLDIGPTQVSVGCRNPAADIEQWQRILMAVALFRLWRHFNTLCTSGLVNDVIISYNGSMAQATQVRCSPKRLTTHQGQHGIYIAAYTQSDFETLAVQWPKILVKI